jgi:hypothetical protein
VSLVTEKVLNFEYKISQLGPKWLNFMELAQWIELNERKN